MWSATLHICPLAERSPLDSSVFVCCVHALLLPEWVSSKQTGFLPQTWTHHPDEDCGQQQRLDVTPASVLSTLTNIRMEKIRMRAIRLYFQCWAAPLTTSENVHFSSKSIRIKQQGKLEGESCWKSGFFKRAHGDPHVWPLRPLWPWDLFNTRSCRRGCDATWYWNANRRL